MLASMSRRTWVLLWAVIAVIAAYVPNKVAEAVLWVTAAEYWYPPAQNAGNPVEDLASIVSFAAYASLLALCFIAVATMTLWFLRQNRVDTWLGEAVSWKDEYQHLKRAFVPLFQKAAGVTYDEASELISGMFPMPDGRRLVALTKNPDSLEALRAWVHLSGAKPLFGYLHVFAWDADDRSGRMEARLRAHLWRHLLEVLDTAHAGKVRWIIEVGTGAGMTGNTAHAIDLYLSQHGYPHLVSEPLSPWRASKTGLFVNRGSREWWEHESGRNIVVILYTDPKPAKQADEEITTLSLICAAAPLARVPLYTSSEQLQKAKTQVEHMAELLALRGFAPGEFRDRADFSGIVDAKALAQWAVREVVLDTEPARVMEGL